VLDRTASEIADTAQRTGAIVHGPIPLPTRIERYKTPFSAVRTSTGSLSEQFEIRTHKRLVDILQPTGKTIEALNKGLSLPPASTSRFASSRAAERRRLSRTQVCLGGLGFPLAEQSRIAKTNRSLRPNRTGRFVSLDGRVLP